MKDKPATRWVAGGARGRRGHRLLGQVDCNQQMAVRAAVARGSESGGCEYKIFSNGDALRERDPTYVVDVNITLVHTSHLDSLHKTLHRHMTVTTFLRSIQRKVGI